MPPSRSSSRGTARAEHRPHPARSSFLFATGILTGVLLVLILDQLWPPAVPRDELRYRETRDFVRSNFVREVDPQSLADDALRGLVEGLDDYSRYYTGAQVAGIERETTGRFRGIGAVFKEPLDEGVVLFALPDSPAERAGLQVGDRLLEIEGRAFGDLEPGGLAQVLGDESRDTLVLLVRGRSGGERRLTVTREVVADPSVRHARIVDAERGIGYLAVRSFSETTPREFDRALVELEERGLEALIVDVRGNFGGLLSAAVELANRFLSEGVIVSTQGRGAPVVYEARGSLATWEGLPLVLLVDSESASASEVFAAALQDHRLAAVVGAPTYGKGTVQRVRTLDAGRSLVKLSTSYYFTPAGRNLERSVAKAWEFGILPDVWIELDPDAKQRARSALERYSPPSAALPALRAWELEEQLELLSPPPDDAQFLAALALLRGERPSSLADSARAPGTTR